MGFAGSHVTGCLREGAKSYVKPVSGRHHGPARSDSSDEDLLALLAQLPLRPDVPVERHGPDTEFAAEC